MSADITVPALPESVTEGTLLAWKKKPGEAVKRGEHVVDLETDKVVLEVTALADGVLAEILKPEGSVVKSGEAIARINAGAAAAAAAPAASPVPPEPPPLSPAVRRLVEEHQLDPAAIPASGREGRLLKEDVQKHLQAPAAAPAAAVARSEPVAAYLAVPAAGAGARPEQRVPMTRLRARVAERLKAAQNSAAILTTFNEVNMKPVMDLRARYRDAFEKKHGVKLGFMSFFVRAVVEALKRFPVVNASVDGSDIVYHGYYDIGIAVGSPRGLVVPILRDADQLSLAAVEKAIKDFGERARDGKLGLEELMGGTFSITNGGIFGSMLSTPILNPPQSAILGMHNIVERPVAENGQVVIRPVMYLALSYDHRIIDGREAVQALYTIKECLEDPARLLLEV